MKSAENAAYKELMALIEPGEGKVSPTAEYAELMRRESAAERILSVHATIPGILRESDWVRSIISARRDGDQERAAAYAEFMRLRQEAFAVSETKMDVVLAASAIENLMHVQDVEPDFLWRQSRRWQQATRCTVYLLPSEVVCGYLGAADSRVVFVGADPSSTAYEEFPPGHPGPHELWHPADSPEAASITAAHRELLRKLTGENFTAAE